MELEPIYIKCGGGLDKCMDDFDPVIESITGEPFTETNPETGERNFKWSIQNKVYFSKVYTDDLVIVPAQIDEDNSIIQQAITGGPHLRIQMRQHGADPTLVTNIYKGVMNWISNELPWDQLDTPQEALDRLGLSRGQLKTYRHYTPNGTSIMVREKYDKQGNVIGHTTVPENPKGVW